MRLALQDGRSALHCAAAAGKLKVLKVLRDLGADLAMREVSGRTAYELAAIHGHHQLVSTKQEKLWETAWMPPRPDLQVVTARYISMRPRPGRVHWTDVNQKRLRTSAKVGDANSVRDLLDAGADPDLKDEFGRTATDFAAEYGHKDVIEELREADRDRHVPDPDEEEERLVEYIEAAEDFESDMEDLEDVAEGLEDDAPVDDAPPPPREDKKRPKKGRKARVAISYDDEEEEKPEMATAMAF